MSLLPLHRSCRLLVGIASVLVLASACTARAPEAAVPAAGALRVMVRLAATTAAPADPGRLARQATQAAGVPVTYGAAAGGRWHSLVVHCAGKSACDGALRGLAADPALFDSVEPDGMRQVPAPVSSSPSL